MGIKLPKTVKHALEIDKETGMTFWKDAIKKEVAAVWKAFEFLDEDAPDPVGHKSIDVHMVFDEKADFTTKARLVAGGHLTADPRSWIHSSH